MNFTGLSTDQAPPIDVPLRFFLTAPLFGVLAGILLLFSDITSFMSRYSIEAIVTTHIITVGFFSFVMFGALTQMLPVLAGAKIYKVVLITRIAHLLMSFGLIMMILGLLQNSSLFSLLSFLSLGSGFFIMIISVLSAIRGVKNITATILGMRTSMFFAFIIVVLGIFLLSSYITGSHSELHLIVANIHSVMAIFGFIGILIIGVSFQVLPMFYVAPHFKNFCTNYILHLVSAGLVIWLLLNLFLEEYAFLGKVWIALFFLAFATTIWKKLNERKRPISDVTIWYWRASSIFLALGVFLWVFDEFISYEYIVMVAILIGGGFIFSIMTGMLYKIIPFLVWFHLNAMGYMTIPTITEMIDKRLAKIQFSFFIVALIGFIISFHIPYFFEFSAISFIISMIVLQYNILAPILIYLKTKKTEPDFDMSAFK
ncbi:MAG: hypothetical protein U9P38_04550 [Campylobacterota bacterium]|nr:hypothetical protein [Campylobacterota bacterium]